MKRRNSCARMRIYSIINTYLCRKAAARISQTAGRRNCGRRENEQIPQPLITTHSLTPLPMTNHELKALRLSLQMNQKEFADSFGVSLRTLQAYESGLTPIPESRIRAYQAEHPQSTPPSDPQPASSAEATQGQLPFAPTSTDNDDTIEDPTTEIAILRERVRYLQQLVDEKERTIQILLQQNRFQPS